MVQCAKIDKHGVAVAARQSQHARLLLVSSDSAQGIHRRCEERHSLVRLRKLCWSMLQVEGRTAHSNCGEEGGQAPGMVHSALADLLCKLL